MLDEDLVRELRRGDKDHGAMKKSHANQRTDLTQVSHEPEALITDQVDVTEQTFAGRGG